jgi:hypothetical protein
VTAKVTKVVGYGLTGTASGIKLPKIVGYILMQPGAESGVTPPVHHSFTYGQRLKLPGQ